MLTSPSGWAFPFRSNITLRAGQCDCSLLDLLARCLYTLWCNILIGLTPVSLAQYGWACVHTKTKVTSDSVLMLGFYLFRFQLVDVESVLCPTKVLLQLLFSFPPWVVLFGIF